MLVDEPLERTVLGTIIAEKINILELPLSLDDFNRELHKNLYSAIRKLALEAKQIDPLLLKGEGIERNELFLIINQASFQPYLADHIERLTKLTFLRKLRYFGHQVVNLSEEITADKNKILDETLSMAAELSETITQKDEYSGFDIIEIFEASQERRQRGEDLGLLTGFKRIDEITKGFKGGQLIVVAGRAKMGKTIWCCNLTLSCLKQRKAALYYSFEMRPDELADRFISMLSGVPLEQLETGFTDDATTRAREKLFTDNLVVVAGRTLEINELKIKTRKIIHRLEKAKKVLGLVIVDLLTHVRTDKKERRELEVAAVSRELKVLAQELDVPVVAVSQLNRAVEFRQSPRPKISDLRESGAIEQDADKIFLLYRPEYYLTQKPESELTPGEKELLKKVAGTCEINIAAQRQGTNGIVFVQFDGKCARFRPLVATERVQKAFGAEIVEGPF